MEKIDKGFVFMMVLYLISVVAGNLLVLHFGPPGILITSLIFIPFDFVIRCYIHEIYKGFGLYTRLFFIVFLGAIITYWFNHDAENIALGSVFGFVAGTAAGSLIYQLAIQKAAFLKVNLSDIFALICDSLVFQYVAFSSINGMILLGQIAIKIAGGLIWYWILIHKFKLLERLKNASSRIIVKQKWREMYDTRRARTTDCILFLDGIYYVVELNYRILNRVWDAQIYYVGPNYDHTLSYWKCNARALFNVPGEDFDAQKMHKRALEEARKIMLNDYIVNPKSEAITA